MLSRCYTRDAGSPRIPTPGNPNRRPDPAPHDASARGAGLFSPRPAGRARRPGPGPPSAAAWAPAAPPRRPRRAAWPGRRCGPPAPRRRAAGGFGGGPNRSAIFRLTSALPASPSSTPSRISPQAAPSMRPAASARESTSITSKGGRRPQFPGPRHLRLVLLEKPVGHGQLLGGGPPQEELLRAVVLEARPAPLPPGLLAPDLGEHASQVDPGGLEATRALEHLPAQRALRELADAGVKLRHGSGPHARKASSLPPGRDGAGRAGVRT